MFNAVSAVARQGNPVVPSSLDENASLSTSMAQVAQLNLFANVSAGTPASQGEGPTPPVPTAQSQAASAQQERVDFITGWFSVKEPEEVITVSTQPSNGQGEVVYSVQPTKDNGISNNQLQTVKDGYVIKKVTTQNEQVAQFSYYITNQGVLYKIVYSDGQLAGNRRDHPNLNAVMEEINNLINRN